jgi:hypothetical protein
MHYVEDRFHVPVAMQETVANALADAGTERFRLPDDLPSPLVRELPGNEFPSVSTCHGPAQHGTDCRVQSSDAG